MNNNANVERILARGLLYRHRLAVLRSTNNSEHIELEPKWFTADSMLKRQIWYSYFRLCIDSYEVVLTGTIFVLTRTM